MSNEKILFDFSLTAEHETEGIYHQRLKDCVWLLNDLEVPV